MSHDNDPLRRLCPFASRFADVGGLRLHYLDEGRGDPVVMLHGNPSWSFMYRELVRELRGSCRAIVPDHIGCGLSEKPGDDRYDYALESRVRDLEAFLSGLGVTRNVTLVLHDWGGMIGMAWAHRHPEAVKRFVLLNTAAFSLPGGKSLPWTLRLARGPAGAVLVRGLNAFARGAARFGCPRRPMSRDVRDAFLRPYDSWENRIAVHRFVQDIPLEPADRSWPVVKEVEDGLKRFADRPVFIGWGGRDFVFDADFLAAWLRLLPRAEVKLVPDAGHCVLEDAPDLLLPAIRDFLERHPLARMEAAA